MRKERLLLTLIALAATVTVGASLALAASSNSPTAVARAATDRYHDISLALADGYGEFRDAQGIACIDQPGVGAMGVHFVNGSFVGDTVLDPAKPEALVYEPRKFSGGYKLVALEYIVFKEAWDAHAHVAADAVRAGVHGHAEPEPVRDSSRSTRCTPGSSAGTRWASCSRGIRGSTASDAAGERGGASAPPACPALARARESRCPETGARHRCRGTGSSTAGAFRPVSGAFPRHLWKRCQVRVPGTGFRRRRRATGRAT